MKLGLFLALAMLLASGPAAASTQDVHMAWHAQDMQVLLGEPRLSGEALVVNLDAAGKSLVALPPPDKELQALPYLEIAFEGAAQALELQLIWQPASGGPVQRIRLPKPGGQSTLLNAGTHSEWHGRVELLAIGAAGKPGDTLALQRIALHPAATGLWLRSTLQGWTDYQGVSPGTINAHRGLRPGFETLSPTMAVAAVILLACALLLLARPRRLWPSVLLISFMGWLALDALWLSHSLRQASENFTNTAGKDTKERLESGAWGDIYRFTEAVKLNTEPETGRFIVASADEFKRLLTHYYLLPRFSYWERNTPELPAYQYLQRGDYLVVTYPSQVQFDRANSSLAFAGRKPLRVEQVLSTEAGALFRLL